MAFSPARNFGKISNRKTSPNREVVVNFEGGELTSNAGITLIADLDKKLRITEQLSKCFRDYRHPSYQEYSVHQLLAQRLYGLILGYEDLNDHEQIRYDPALRVALDKLGLVDSKTAVLAGKSTLNRLEYCPETVLDQEKSRYHKIEAVPEEIERALVEIFLAFYKSPPRQIVVDMDVTDDQVHGNQEGAFFNTYYDGVCYAPLYIFCGPHLLAAKLRSSNVDPAEGALPELQRIIGLIREKWPDTHIIIRGDSAYSREEIMKFCEEQEKVDYVFALATNAQLKRRAADVIEKAQQDYEQRLEPVTQLMETLFAKGEDLEEVKELVPQSTWYRSLIYQTQKTWSRSRRVVTKVHWSHKGLKLRHVVTSLKASKISPSLVYTDKYCPRGDMENRIKEQQLDLFADRTSTQTFASNQLRLWLSSFAYVLVQAFRQHCLPRTSLAQATVGKIRLSLFKLGAKITFSVRRLVIAIASSFPEPELFMLAASRIQSLPNTG